MQLLAPISTLRCLVWTACNTVFFCCLIPCFLWYIYAIKAAWQKKAFIFLITVTGILFINSICNCVMNTLQGNGDWLPDMPMITVVSLVLNAVVVPLLCLFFKHFYLPSENGMSAKEVGYLCVPLLLMFLIFFVVFSFIDFIFLVSNLTVLLLYFGLLITVFILYSVIFKMYALAHERHAAHEKQLQAEYQIKIRDERYKHISDNIESSRKMRHDIRHHLLALKGFLNSGETESALEYLNRYFDNSESHRVLKYCNNPIVNMLAGHYHYMAKEHDIRFSVHINIPDDLPIQDMDISVLLGNLLGNAIEGACLASEEQRSVDLNMFCSGKMLAITVDNGFDGIVKKNGNEYVSTKSEERGLGLPILTSIA